MVASELLEAGRAIGMGYVTPDRTVLIAGTERAFTTKEKLAPGDGRYSDENLLRAARERSRELRRFPFRELAAAAGASLNAVLLGAMAGCEKMPLVPDQLKTGIIQEEKAVTENLRGFEAGLRAMDGSAPSQGGVGASETPAHPVLASGRIAPRVRTAFHQRIEKAFPLPVQSLIQQGLARTIAYQDSTYGGLYLDRLEAIQNAPQEVLETVARHLAQWMTYEDVIRVAQLKIQPERYHRLRLELAAGKEEPVRVTEFLMPGMEEICDLMPGGIARPMLSLAARWKWLGKKRWRIHLRSDTLSGFLKLRILAALRPWRRLSSRFRREESAINQWLEDLRQALELDPGLALNIARSADLIRGYGETHARGRRHYSRIQNSLVGPALAGQTPPAKSAEAIGYVHSKVQITDSEADIELVFQEVGNR